MQAHVLATFVTYLGIAGPYLTVHVGHNWIVLPVIAGDVVLTYGCGAMAALASTHAFVWLGKISYCFYSFQALLILVLVDQHSALVRSYPWLASNWALCGIGFIFLITMSAGEYYLVEEPGRR